MGLREVRVERGLTQGQLARLTGIAQCVISGYECGRRDVRNMTLASALKLPAALGCEPADLVDGWDWRPRPRL